MKGIWEDFIEQRVTSFLKGQRFTLLASPMGIAIMVALFAVCSVARANSAVSPDCSFEGKRLFGKIQEVNSFPDIKVQVVSSFPDLKVQKVQSFPDSCGKWEMVDSFPDLKVQFVDSFPDVKIQYVEAFPGMP